jgi:hypothetical protein
MNPRVAEVIYQTPYKLLLTFTNGERKEFDLSSFLNYPVYQVLKDEIFCKRCKVYNGTVVWDIETDFDPDTLYLESKELACLSN